MMAEMSFIVDGMLGKLAGRLRLLGFDTAYFSDAEDSDLLRIGRDEGRILLTRDRELTKVRGANAFFVKSKKLAEQLQEVITAYNLAIEPAKYFTRCSVCNTVLEKNSQAKAKNKVPPLVYQTFQEFSYCPNCRKFYWKGTHFDKIIAELKLF